MARTLPTALLILAALTVTAAAEQPPLRFTCDSARPGYTTLTSNSTYIDTKAGFDLGIVPAVADGSCSDTRPFFFSTPIPPGNYRVSVTLGGPAAAVTTVWAEARRLMLLKVHTAANASTTRVFDVNVRIPRVPPDGQTIHLKTREHGDLDWDHKLTIEFNGDHPSFRSISIQPAQVATLYIAGDSTVVDWQAEPHAAWGQMLPVFFLPGIAVANYAEQGETIKSFIAENRLAKIMSLIQPGDYLFIQFAHNDQKRQRGTHHAVVPIKQYKELLNQFISQTRAKKATPVLVTSMNRRTFDASGHITNSLAGYPGAMRQVAAATHTPLIDLNAMSKTLFEAIGPQGTLKVFAHFPANAYPNQPKAIDDNTHFTNYGAYELARSIVHGIRQDKLPIVKFLDPFIPAFDPAHPDSIASVNLPDTSPHLRPPLPPPPVPQPPPPPHDHHTTPRHPQS